MPTATVARPPKSGLKSNMSRGIVGTDARSAQINQAAESLSIRWKRLCDEGARHSRMIGLTEESIQNEISKYYDEQRALGAI